MVRKNKKIVKQITQKAKHRLKMYLQKGGVAPRTNNFSSSGNFGNLIEQMGYFFVNSVASMVDGVNAVVSIVELPGDMGTILGKPNEPLPTNTKISKLIDYT